MPRRFRKLVDRNETKATTRCVVCVEKRTAVRRSNDRSPDRVQERCRTSRSFYNETGVRAQRRTYHARTGGATGVFQCTCTESAIGMGTELWRQFPVCGEFGTKDDRRGGETICTRPDHVSSRQNGVGGCRCRTSLFLWDLRKVVVVVVLLLPFGWFSRTKRTRTIADADSPPTGRRNRPRKNRTRDGAAVRTDTPCNGDPDHHAFAVSFTRRGETSGSPVSPGDVPWGDLCDDPIIWRVPQPFSSAHIPAV